MDAQMTATIEAYQLGLKRLAETDEQAEAARAYLHQADETYVQAREALRVAETNLRQLCQSRALGPVEA